MFCPECGSDVISSNEPIQIQIHGDVIAVGGIEYEQCPQCGETLLSAHAASQLQRKGNAAYRLKHGYLTGSEIKAIRNKVGYSQESLEALIKAGPKSFSRWEKGTVIQKGPTDVLLRVIDRFPMILEWLNGSSVLLQQGSISVNSSDVLATNETDRRLVA